MDFDAEDFHSLENYLKLNKISKEDICLVGSTTLSLIGIRKHNDIDIVIHSKNTNKNLSSHQFIERVNNPWSTLFSDDNLIENSELYILYNGFKFVIPELIYHKKIWHNRKKDQKDIIELSEFAKMSSSWNWAIIDTHLPKKNLFKKFFTPINNRLKSLRNKIKKSILSLSLHQDLNQVISTNILLSKQIRSKRFNRYDLMVRFMVIESVISKNEDAFEMYNQMQEKRGNSPHKNPLETFKNLIKEIQHKGYNMQSKILVNKQMHIIDGAHRFACALYFNEAQIPVEIVGNNTKFYYGINWFKQNEFLDSIIEILKAKKQEIFFNNNLYFEVILWPPVALYFNEIEQDIKSEYTILSSNTYKDFPNFEKYVNTLYEIDDIKKWKVKMKLEGMKKYPLIFRRILISISDPDFRYKESNGYLISQKVESLKKKIRKKYSPEVDGYFYDIIIHIGDNYEHSRLSKQLLDE